MWAIATIDPMWLDVIQVVAGALLGGGGLWGASAVRKPKRGQTVPVTEASDEDLEAELHKRRGPAEQTAALTIAVLEPKLDAVLDAVEANTESNEIVAQALEGLRGDLEKRARSRTPSRGSEAISRD